MAADTPQPATEAQVADAPPAAAAGAPEPMAEIVPDDVIIREVPAPVADPAPATAAAQAGYSPDAVLADALARGVEAASAEAAAQPLGVVLGRAHSELRGGGLTGDTRRLLQTALSAANHNPQLSQRARTALAAVAVALRGLDN